MGLLGRLSLEQWLSGQGSVNNDLVIKTTWTTFFVMRLLGRRSLEQWFSAQGLFEQRFGYQDRLDNALCDEVVGNTEFGAMAFWARILKRFGYQPSLDHGPLG